MSSETTSGMTVMRMALTHSVPIGSDDVGGAQQRRVARRGDGDAAAGQRRPRATRTRVLSFIGGVQLTSSSRRR